MCLCMHIFKAMEPFLPMKANVKWQCVNRSKQSGAALGGVQWVSQSNWWLLMLPPAKKAGDLEYENKTQNQKIIALKQRYQNHRILDWGVDLPLPNFPSISPMVPPKVCSHC